MIADLLVLLILAAAVGAGVGGGGLLVVYLTMLRGFGQVEAQAVNLAFFIVAALSSAVLQKKKGTLPPLGLILLASAAALPGVFLGSGIRDLMPQSALRLVFGFLLLVTALLILRREFPPMPLVLRKKRRNFFRLFSGKNP